MLTFEELAVLLSLESDLGLQKTTVALQSTGLYSGERFDRMVALKVIDRLVGIDFISRDRSGFLYLTKTGKHALKETKIGTIQLMSKLLVF